MKKKYPAMNAPAIMKQLGQDWAKVVQSFLKIIGIISLKINAISQVPQGKKESLLSKFEAEKVK